MVPWNVFFSTLGAYLSVPLKEEEEFIKMFVGKFNWKKKFFIYYHLDLLSLPSDHIDMLNKLTGILEKSFLNI